VRRRPAIVRRIPGVDYQRAWEEQSSIGGRKRMPQMPVLGADDRIVQSQQVVATDAGAELILLSLERGRCYGMNGVGTRIWRKLERPMRVDDLVQEVMAEFHADAAPARVETLEFLEQMRREGLIASA
jgi:coenzyme PQQ synthesis protein D (PqqD)